ncbi:MAG: TonB-dependent receptor [Deltaproteobacteria bacterium]|nr:TonB-dependent receptor [Deltaproteobacteria bacterium]
MKRTKQVFLCSLLLSLTAVGQATGEETKKGQPVIMEEVVVTATKTEEKRRDIPNSVIVMDELDIQSSSAKTVGELLSNELGLDWRTYGNYGGASEEIQIRGMGANGTQVFLNGASLNSPSLGSADLAKLPLGIIERIEVVKGSGSLLYGSGAMGGTIHLFTKRPKRNQTDFKAEAGYGTENTYRLLAQHGMFASGDLGYYITAGRQETDGFRDNSDLTHQDVTLQLLLDRGDALEVNLYCDYIDRKYGLPGVRPPVGTQPYSVNGTMFYNAESNSLLNRGADEDGHVILGVKGRPLGWLGYTLRGDYTRMESFNRSRYSFSGTGAETWVTNRVLGAEGNLELRPVEEATLLVGVEHKDYGWENESVSLDTAGAQVAGSRSSTEADLHSTGSFLEAQFKPVPSIKVLAGIRREEHSQFGSENLPRFGMIVNPTDTTSIKFTQGKHFLAPTPNDLYWPAGPYSRGNAELRPEKGWHSDVTMEQSLLKDKVFFAFSYFFWNLEDKIQWAPDAGWVYTPQNLDTYEASGWEMGGRVGPFYGMSLSLSYTMLDAEERNQFTNRDATYTPKDLFKGSVGYESGIGFSAGATVRHTGKRFYYGGDRTISVPTHTLESYWTVDLRVEQRLWNHWVFSFRGNNIFDRDYDTYLSSFTDMETGRSSVAGYPGAGRSFFFGVSYEY